ncbi:MAG: class I SAM-dependent methyltransferase [bacterium]
MLDSLSKVDLATAPADSLAHILMTTSLRKGQNPRINQLEEILRSKVPANILDQIDFTIANHIVNHDEYLRWVIQMIGGWLNVGDGNSHCFNHAIRHMPDGGAVIEIGSFLGVSVSVLSYYLTRLGRTNKLFNADPWHFEETEKPVGGFFDGSRQIYRDYCIETYKKNVSLFCEQNMPITIQAFSDNFFEMWNSGAETTDVFGNKVKLGGPISFAYIDGAHTYEAAKKDFENVARHLLPGGFVLFDDSNPQLRFGCVQSAAEAALTPGFSRVFGHVNGLNVFLRKQSAIRIASV